MFKFKISITILDGDNAQVATIPLPEIDTPVALTKLLTTAENLIKPFLPAVVTAA